MLFQIHIELKVQGNLFKTYHSLITMADLAGSEGLNGESEKLKEGSHINKSLLALTTVVKKLNKKSSFVGF